MVIYVKFRSTHAQLFRISQIIRWIFWIFILTMGVKSFFGHFVIAFNKYLIATERLQFSLFVVAIIILCQYGYATRIKKLTSMTSMPINIVWLVIDRVGLSIFLIHPGVIIAATIINKQALDFDFLMLVG
jgi:hypothetical protein